MTVDRVRAAFAAIEKADRPEVWITLRPEADVAREFEAASEAEVGPLAGLLLAVKNNVDVEGIETTAACPAFGRGPAATDATAVARLRAAGATVIGATNLDQFATGLVGQRSPYGRVRDARRPTHISGGSSSGSSVAVALGFADIAIGTDTAGSGRIPAALQGLVGIKPTLGIVSTEGVLPACRSWDAVTIFARDLDTAAAAMSAMAGGDEARTFPADAPIAAPRVARIAVPETLVGMSPEWEAAFAAAADRLRDDGCVVKTIPFESFFEAARLLYDGALVAERHAAVGEFVDAHPDEVEPTVGAIVSRAGTVRASDMVTDLERLEKLRRRSLALLDGFDALLIPTAPGHPTVEAVAADPIGVNSWMGTYTNFCNLFDLAAVAVPSGTVTDATGTSQFGVTVVARTFADAVALDLARRVQLETPSVASPGSAPALPSTPLPWPTRAGAPSVPLFVVGAHLPGQPLEAQLTARGARWLGEAHTAEAYRLVALDTVPPKPGLVRVGEGGASIVGGLWQVPIAALGTFLAELPAPMNLGQIELRAGSFVTGFGCDAASAVGARDITEHGGWLAYLGV